MQIVNNIQIKCIDCVGDMPTDTNIKSFSQKTGHIKNVFCLEENK